MNKIIIFIIFLLINIANSQNSFFREYEIEIKDSTEIITINLAIYPPAYKQINPDTFLGTLKWKMEMTIINKKSKKTLLTEGRWINNMFNVMLLHADSVKCNNKICWKRKFKYDISNDYWLFKTGKSFNLTQYNLNEQKFILICIFTNKWFLDDWFLDD